MAKSNRATAKQDAPAQDAAAETGAQTETGAQAETTTEAPKAKRGPKLTPISKVTVATVYGAIGIKDLPPRFIGDASDPVLNPDRELKICRIAGYANSTKEGQSSYGPWAALIGEFAATNYSTGEMFAGKTALIPGAMGEMLVTTMQELLTEDANSKMRFSVDISVERSPREPDKKYVYIVRPVIENEISSPALALLEMSA